MRSMLFTICVIISLVSVLADVLGYGDGLAFGRLQVAGTFGGIIIALLVPWFRWRQRRRAAADIVADQRAGSDRRRPA